jgi:hypothetical protein
MAATEVKSKFAVFNAASFIIPLDPKVKELAALKDKPGAEAASPAWTVYLKVKAVPPVPSI